MTCRQPLNPMEVEFRHTEDTGDFTGITKLRFQNVLIPSRDPMPSPRSWRAVRFLCACIALFCTGRVLGPLCRQQVSALCCLHGQVVPMCVGGPCCACSPVDGRRVGSAVRDLHEHPVNVPCQGPGGSLGAVILRVRVSTRGVVCTRVCAHTCRPGSGCAG